MIKAYYLATSQTLKELQQKVNAAIEKGYTPIHPLQEIIFRQEDGQVQGFVQQMIKEEE